MADSTTKTVAFLAVTLQRACHNSFIESGNPGRWGEAGGGCLVGFLFFQKSHHKLSNKKNMGGTHFFREEVEEVQYTKKNGKIGK